jgi:hypothetical protein
LINAAFMAYAVTDQEEGNMMRKFLFIAAMAMLAIPASAQQVEVADGDWSDFPALDKSQVVNLGAGAMADIDKLVAEGKCDRIGNKKRIRMEIPFIAQFNDAGKVQRVMLKRINCPEVETIAASAAFYAAKWGWIEPGTNNEAGWYRGMVNYTLD